VTLRCSLGDANISVGEGNVSVGDVVHLVGERYSQLRREAARAAALEESAVVAQLAAARVQLSGERSAASEAAASLAAALLALRALQGEVEATRRQAAEAAGRGAQGLERRFREQTELLFQKQAQLEQLAAAKAADALKAERELGSARAELNEAARHRNRNDKIALLAPAWDVEVPRSPPCIVCAPYPPGTPCWPRQHSAAEGCETRAGGFTAQVCVALSRVVAERVKVRRWQGGDVVPTASLGGAYERLATHRRWVKSPIYGKQVPCKSEPASALKGRAARVRRLFPKLTRSVLDFLCPITRLQLLGLRHRRYTALSASTPEWISDCSVGHVVRGAGRVMDVSAATLSRALKTQPGLRFLFFAYLMCIHLFLWVLITRMQSRAELEDLMVSEEDVMRAAFEKVNRPPGFSPPFSPPFEAPPQPFKIKHY
jgi:hypothetical protein